MNTLFDETPISETQEATPLQYRQWHEPYAQRPGTEAPETGVVAGSALKILQLEDELAAFREEHERALDEAEERAAKQARDEVQAQYREALEVERTALAHACTSLARERVRYFADMQREVVRLAVAVAERVLHRTIDADPMALAEVVHVALAQLAEPEGAVLHVSAIELERWRRAMRSAGLRVEADESLATGELRLESMGGAAALGWKTQLEEIEHSFDDLLERKQA